MDDADKAAAQQEVLDQAALIKRMPADSHYGYCLNCGEKVGRPYCDEGCEADDKLRTRNGL